MIEKEKQIKLKVSRMNNKYQRENRIAKQNKNQIDKSLDQKKKDSSRNEKDTN